MDVLKQAILQQEAVFRHQVRELHRLYWTQKNLLLELRKRGRDDCWKSVCSVQEHFKRLRAFDLQIPANVGMNLNVGSATIHISASIQEHCPLDSVDVSKEVIGASHDVNLFPANLHPTSHVHIDLNETLVIECSNDLDDPSPTSDFLDGFNGKSSMEEDFRKLEKSDSRKQASVMTSSHETDNLNLGNEIKPRTECMRTVAPLVSEESRSNQVVDSVVTNSFEVKHEISLQVGVCETEEFKLEEGFEVLGSEILKAAETLVQLSIKSPGVSREPDPNPNPEHFYDTFELRTLKLQESKDHECGLWQSLPCDIAKGRDSCGVRLRTGRFKLLNFQKDMLPGIVSLSRHEIREDLHNLSCAVGREKNSDREGMLVLPSKRRRWRSRRPAP